MGGGIGDGTINRMTTIEVSAAEFARMNKGLLTVLRAVEKAGDDGIPTRKLMHKIGMVGYGEKLIKRAEALGYIEREERDPPSSRGFSPKYNILSRKGKKLLSQLQEE